MVYFVGALPIPFEKDDDFQIDFITAATVSFDNNRSIVSCVLIEFKSANVWS